MSNFVKILLGHVKGDPGPQGKEGPVGPQGPAGTPGESGGSDLSTADIFLAAHPIGSYFISSTNTDPGKTYGGSWTRIKDRFIYALGDSGSPGDTGGEANVTLSLSNLPPHTHTMGSHSHDFGSHTHSVPSHTHGLGNHTHGMDHTHTERGFRACSRENAHDYGLMYGGDGFNNRVMIDGGQTTTLTATDSYGRELHTGPSETAYLTNKTNTDAATGTTSSGGSGTTGSASGSSGLAGGGNTGSAGNGYSHNNMPPYIKAYVWRRTA